MRKSVIIAAFCTLLLTACGTASEETVTQTAGLPVETTQEQDGTVSLTVWGAEEDQEMLGQMAAAFEEKYKGAADFEIAIAVQSESQCRDTLLGDVLNGADVFAFADDQLLALAASGALLEVENAEEVRAANVAEASAAASIGDRLYAFPMTADNGYFMYYNKDYFSDEDVKTLEGMLNVAAAAEKKLTMDWTSGWYLYSFFGNTGMSFGLNEDGVTNFCDWNRTSGGITGKEVTESMLLIAQHPGFLNAVDTEFVEGVKNGTVIAGVSGVWNAAIIRQCWGDDYGAVKLPTYTCNGEQTQMASFSGYKMVGVNAYSEHPEWAMKLADWITNEENQKLRFTMRAQGPSNMNAADSPEVQKEPAIRAVLAQSEYAVLQRVGNSYWEPVQKFGETIAAGNPEGQDVQELLDKMTSGITASVVQ